MRKRDAIKVLRKCFIPPEEESVWWRYNRLTIERAIRKLNPSAWLSNWEHQENWSCSFVWGFRNKKIRSIISKELRLKYQQDLEELWSKM